MTVNGESYRAVEINGKVYHSVQEMIERIIELEKKKDMLPEDAEKAFRKRYQTESRPMSRHYRNGYIDGFKKAQGD